MSRPFGVARDAPLMHLPRATRFSEDGDLRDAVAVVRYIKGQPAILAELRAGFEPAPDETGTQAASTPLPTFGRPRADGDWPLLFVAFVLSRVKSVQHWVHLYEHSPIWQTCGFPEPPSYATVNRRFKELEQRLSDRDPGTDGFTAPSTPASATPEASSRRSAAQSRSTGTPPRPARRSRTHARRPRRAGSAS